LKAALFARETAMKMKFVSTTGIVTLLAVAAFMVESLPVHAAPKKRFDDRNGVFYYGPNGPNRSYQAGPHTRIYVTTRSWLDAGTEVLPGDRKFSDYAFPPGYSFGRENGNRPIDRQPLNPASDFGGIQQVFPLY
jgi:hypothetical protein